MAVLVYSLSTSAQHWNPVSRRSAQHVHTAQTAQTPLARPHPLHAKGKRTTRQPQLQYGDVLKCDMKTVDINTESWESLAANRSKWRGALTNQLKAGEEKLTQAAHRNLSGRSDRPETEHKCDLCNRDCHSHIGLYSHRCWCSSRTD